MSQQDLNRFGLQLQDELNQAVAGIKTKGAQHFKKPLGVAAALAAVSYLLLYQATSQKLTAINGQVYTLREVSQYAEQYRDLRNRLTGLAVKFPKDKDRRDWLFNLINSSAKLHGVKIDSLSAQRETEKQDLPFVLLTYDVSAMGNFHRLGAWTARLESAGYFTQLEAFSLEKGQDENSEAVSDVRTAKLTLTTALPKGMEGL